MTILLNGIAEEVADAICVAQLLARMGLMEQRLAVEINGEIAPRASFATRQLTSGDRVEIVRAVGGG